jgi:DUF3102 family protein
MTTLAKRTESKPARPLGVLIPLIREDIKQMNGAAEEAVEIATLPFKIAIGEKLIEAKNSPEMRHGDWKPWLERNFHLSYRSAIIYMQMAGVDKAKVNRDSHLSQSDFIRKHITPSHGRSATPEWLPEMKNRVERINVDRLTKPVADEETEDKLERKLALDLIDIGYKVLSVKLHPDKGGSKDAMTRLNNVRENLKACVDAW